MKLLPLHSSLSAFAAAALLCISPSAQATVIYEDNFNGLTGSLLQGRSPNLVNTTGNTYQTLAPTDQLQVNGSGLLGTTGSGGVAYLALPTLTQGDVITLTMSLRPAAASSNFISIGLSNGSGDLISSGAAWALLSGTGGPDAGQVQVFSGGGTAGGLYFSSGAEPTWGGSSPSIFTLTYNTGTGNLQVQLGSATLFNGIIDYNGTTDTAAPLSAIGFVTMQWLNVDSINSSDPGYVDSLKVEVVPEPSTMALLALGMAGAVIFYRKRRATVATV